MPQNIENYVNKILKEYKVGKADLTGIAVSGGADSMCLLSILLKLKYKVHLIHINHGIRKESEIEEKFLKDYCTANKISYSIEKIKLKSKKNYETEAREKRYKVFEKIAKEKKLKFVLTAHHLEDSFETLIINLIRGTGIKGLLGIPKQRDYLLRPLNLITKKQILEYNKKNKLVFFHDYSNDETSTIRNKIRKIITPIFSKENKSFWQSFSETLTNLENSEKISSDSVKKWIKKNLKKEKNGFILNKKGLKNTELFFVKEIFREIFQSLNKTTIKTGHLAEIINNISSNSYREKEFGKNWTLIINKNLIRFFKKDAAKYKLKYQIQKNTEIKNLKSKQYLYVDADKISNLESLKQKYIDKTDIFIPFSSKKSQKILDFLSKKKILKKDRGLIPLLIDGEKTVCVGNIEISDEYKISKKSQKILKIDMV